jgi:hypothetical protein
MHPLFNVTELLRLILEHLDREDQVNCAVICKTWSEVVLDVVWYEVDNLAILANLLSPVKKRTSERGISYVSEPN